MKLKKILGFTTAVVLGLTLTACGGGANEGGAPEQPAAASGEIHVVSREDGSGTRTAFVELTGVMVKENDQEVDKTVETAQISPSTNEVMTFVSSDESSIGYISLGSLNDTVKAVKIEGIAPTPDTVKSGEYKISRPFNIAYKQLNDVSQDFVNFIMSDEGQKVAEGKGYIPVASGAYTPAEGLSGTIRIQGSTSVAPVMEKIMEAYKAKQPNVTVEIQPNGSSAGITAVMNNSCDIGMASRALKDDEKAALTGQEIAQDGIVVIVNKNSSIEDLSLDQVRQIFVGEVVDWSQLQK